MGYLNIGIIVTAVLATILVLIQDRSSGAGAFGGSDIGGFYQQRRGLERGLFIFTIIIITVFAAFSLLNLTSYKNIGAKPIVKTPVAGIQLKTDNPNVKVTPVTEGGAAAPSAAKK